MTQPEQPYYNANFPLVTSPFSEWQRVFLKNFEQMSLAFKQNHIPLEDPSLSGNHTIVQMPEQAEGTKVKTNIGDFAIFTRLIEGQTDQVVMQSEGNLPEFQYTNYQIYPVKDVKDGATVVQKTYFTTLPGKMIVIFGSKLATKGKIPTIRLLPPVIKNIVSVNLTLIGTFPIAPARAYEVTPIESTINDQKYFNSIDVTFSLGKFNPFYFLVVGNL